ncbi:MAG: helix-turn-helix transcriptional regulator [Merismopedia sp. SIO2A8]|nr:helix-turn-helix transcriptional regulator [Symploca sp. SIO2B6]NET47348.1 helix-turn-helix transcriptional regulator [Merismopedia sp. SIO2A8]
MTVLIRLKELRRSRDISQNELARAINMSVTNLRKIEGNVAKGIPLNTMDALCKVLKCHPGELFEYIPDDDSAA